MCSVYTMYENAKNIIRETEKDIYFIIYTLRINNADT